MNTLNRNQNRNENQSAQGSKGSPPQEVPNKNLKPQVDRPSGDTRSSDSQRNAGSTQGAGPSKNMSQNHPGKSNH